MYSPHLAGEMSSVLLTVIQGLCAPHHVLSCLSSQSSLESSRGFLDQNLSFLAWTLKLWLSSCRQYRWEILLWMDWPLFLGSSWPSLTCTDILSLSLVKERKETEVLLPGDVLMLEAPKLSQCCWHRDPLLPFSASQGFTLALPALSPSVQCLPDWPASKNWHTGMSPKHFLSSNR